MGLKCHWWSSLGILTAVWYRDEILQPHTVPFVQQNNLTVQQDNAICPPSSTCGISQTGESGIVQTYPLPLPSSDMPWSTNGTTFQWGMWMPWWIPWPGGSGQLHIHSTSETSKTKGLIHRLTRVKCHLTDTNAFFPWVFDFNCRRNAHLQWDYVAIFFHI